MRLAHLEAPSVGALRFEAGRRRRLRSAVIVASILVAFVALGDGLASHLLDPGNRTANVVLDAFIILVACAVALTRSWWRFAPALPGLVLGYLVVNNTFLTMVAAPQTFGLALAYLSMTLVAAPILFPWSRRFHAAFLVGALLLAAGYGIAIASLRIAVPLHDLFVAVAGAVLVSAVTHEVLLRLALAEHDQRRRVREFHAALRRKSEALQEREGQLAEAQAIGRIGSWEWNVVDGTVIWSEEQRRILGVGPDVEPSYEKYLSLIHPEDRPLAVRLVAAALKTGRFEGDVRNITPHGEERWMHVRGLAHHDANGTPVRVTGISQEITERKVAEAKLERLALHDALTGLPNRTLFRDRLGQALAAGRLRKRSRKQIAVAFIDLDDFKLVNDSVGHGSGDELLRIVAGRLAAATRAGDTVARLGGDEFAVLLLDVDGAVAFELCQRLLETLATPLEIGDREYLVSASVGFACSPSSDITADDLLRYADVAMYEAKADGKGRVIEFKPEMAHGLRERGVLREELRRALGRDELFVLFQPQIELKSGSIVGVEALVRWRHPERGIVSPDAFIPLAEESGLIVELDGWVIRQACRQLRAWLSAGLPRVRVAVNASVRSIEQPSFLALIQSTIADLRLPPSLLEIEITESQVIGDGWQSTRAVAALREMGVGIAIDDFGTGYSVLARLNEIAFDTLKIDRRFIGEVEAATDAHPLLLAMISMAKALDVKIVAEGIETEAQLGYLRNHGCDEGQGFLFSPPVDASTVARLLSTEAAA